MFRIVWLTGPSGSGKTTLARKLQEEWPCIILDGDEMRRSISEGAGFSRADRAKHNYRVARLAKELVKQMNVIVAVIAPIKEVRDTIQDVMWIYLKRTVPEREGHFYEVSDEYPMIDCDLFNPAQCVTILRASLAKTI
ncbi:MAG: adenylyl-sulfate kinase [Planctomycetota bacterium]|jgi:adenylylsulfate kinase-like enzyme